MLMAKVKQTTGIVGLEVVPNARGVLISLYTMTLKEIQAVPEDEGYRKSVESFTPHCLGICPEEGDWEQIGKCVGCGQVEELIEEAEDELKLISKMIVKESGIPGVFPKITNVRSLKTTRQSPNTFLSTGPGPLPEEFYKPLEAVTTKPALEDESAPQLKE